jgi:hypothetical protein
MVEGQVAFVDNKWKRVVKRPVVRELGLDAEGTVEIKMSQLQQKISEPNFPSILQEHSPAASARIKKQRTRLKTIPLEFSSSASASDSQFNETASIAEEVSDSLD